VLRPGGFLIVTQITPIDGVTRGRSESTVRLCEEAGLQYWQHVIALLVPIQEGQLQPQCRRRARAHADLLVFRKPPPPVIEWQAAGAEAA
jgi:hypothetical protein